ncbi:MAG: hypothetical protein ABS948_06610 [Solibacillus sp.]
MGEEKKVSYRKFTERKELIQQLLTLADNPSTEQIIAATGLGATPALFVRAVFIKRAEITDTESANRVIDNIITSYRLTTNARHFVHELVYALLGQPIVDEYENETLLDAAKDEEYPTVAAQPSAVLNSMDISQLELQLQLSEQAIARENRKKEILQELIELNNKKEALLLEFEQLNK